MFEVTAAIDDQQENQQIIAGQCQELSNALNNCCFVDRVLPRKCFKVCVNNVKEKFLQTVKYPSSLNCHQIVDEVTNCCGGKKISGYLIFSKYFDLESDQIILREFPQEPVCVDEFANGIIDSLSRIGNLSKAKEYLSSASVMEFESERRRIRFRLNHHSVVFDRLNNYIECLYERYPTPKQNSEVNYLFIPHQLGALGICFDAYFQISK